MNYTFSFTASSEGHKNTVECLALKGAEVNFKDDFGYSPLYSGE